MTGATMCSGIMAPEEAMPWVDWKWCAEIDPFACSVIAQRHPDIPNLGDITASDFIEQTVPVDLLVAGTPCQAFSVAGLRKSLTDERGNLTMRFVEVIHAIKPRITLWENVPGVLSTHDNAFGCFLAGLVGADEAIAPPTGWTSAGVVTGPLGTAAWRILDAQYFRLAQRRARLFVVFCFGDNSDPAQVLLEFESVRRDSPPSRETGQGVAADVAPSLTNSGRGFERAGESRGQDPVIAMCLNGKGGAGRIDAESETFIAQLSPTVNSRIGDGGYGHSFDLSGGLVTHSLRADGFDASEDGTGRGTPLVVAGTLKANNGGGGFGSDPSETFVPVCLPILEAGARTGKSTDDPRAGIGIGESGDPMFTLQSGKQDAIAFSAKDHGADAGDLAPTLRSMSHDGSHANGGGQVAIAFDTTQITSAKNRSKPKAGDACHQLAAGAHPPAIAFTERGREDGRSLESQDELAYALCNPGSGGRTHSRQILTPQMAVRRLTPLECERLMGFCDGFTNVLYRGKLAADGPRYRALGNSMAVPVVRWIGERIRAVTEKNCVVGA